MQPQKSGIKEEEETVADGAQHRDTASLSSRQRQILALLTEGKVNKEIAAELGIGLGTVKQHVVALFKKLNVTNRAMAVSRGLAMEGAPTGNPSNPAAASTASAGSGAVVERRPAVVLSLELVPLTHKPEASALRGLHRTFTEVAFDFDALFFTHHGGRCEMIFGIQRVRRHDVLRAIRAAVAVAVDIKAQCGQKIALKGGLSCGILIASMDRWGKWSGEAIAGNVISSARGLASKASPGMLRLDDPTRDMIMFIGAEDQGDVPESIPLSRSFVWSRSQRPSPPALRGRNAELEMLRSSLFKLKSGVGGVAFVECESGMGRSALLRAFEDICQQEGEDAQVWGCFAPDSQPASPSSGRMAQPGSKDIFTVAEVREKLTVENSDGGHVILIDDCHLLPGDCINDLERMIKDLSSAPYLFVLTSRGRMPLPDPIRSKATILPLKRLYRNETLDVIRDRLGDGHPDERRIEKLAAGVPVFAVELTRHARSAADTSNPRGTPAPPLTLFSIIAERIDAMELDHRLLHLAALLPTPLTVDELRRRWPENGCNFSDELTKAVDSGLLCRRTDAKTGNETIRFNHPFIRHVVAFNLAQHDG